MTATTPISPLTAIATDLGALVVLRAAQGETLPVPASLVEANPQAAPPQTTPPSALQAAVSNQGGLAALFADLSAGLQSPQMPPSVQAAIAAVRDFQLSIDPPPTAAALRQAVAQSGLFLEARLAGADTPTGDDLKTALLTLTQALRTWAGAAVPRPSFASPPPAPPRPGGPVRGQPAAQSTLPPDASAEEVAGRLIKQTGAALSRQMLMQAASTSAGDPRAVDAGGAAQWLFEIPLATPQGAAVAQFEIDRDGSAADAEADQRVWRARFSLDIDPMGPVHAEVSLKGGKARVALWAGKSETIARLSQQKGELSEALRAGDFDPLVVVFPGAPSVAPPSAGQFMDKAV